jgi:CheY-like chemotaxis protein
MQPVNRCLPGYPPDHPETIAMKPVKSILLIDPNAEVREVLRLCLHDFGGWKVIPATSAQEGLEKLTAEHPDAVLVDILIPQEADGLRLIQTLRAHPLGRSIPIILITARAHWFNAHQIREMGVVGAVAKPFNPLTLPKQVAQLLHWSIEQH